MHYVVIANQTLGGEALQDALVERARQGPSRFHVVVPARRNPRGLTWTEGASRAAAERRLAEGLRWMRSLGLQATGEVGDENPVEAVEDALRVGSYDEIVLSTLPAGVSRWLHQDLPARLRRRVHAPVALVVSYDEGLARRVA